MNASVPFRIVLLGLPASGKSTQGQLLSSHWQLPITSTGALLRRERNLGTSLGLDADRVTSLGQLVPDDVVTESMGAWLDSEANLANGFILDGTPRTLGQVIELDKMLAERGLPITHALSLEVSFETAADRVFHRSICARCGRPFRVGVDVQNISAACPICGGALERRNDDTTEALTQRISEFQEKTAPLLTFYESSELLRRVHGEGSSEEVFARVIDALEGRQSSAFSF